MGRRRTGDAAIGTPLRVVRPNWELIWGDRFIIAGVDSVRDVFHSLFFFLELYRSFSTSHWQVI